MSIQWFFGLLRISLEDDRGSSDHPAVDAIRVLKHDLKILQKCYKSDALVKERMASTFLLKWNEKEPEIHELNGLRKALNDTKAELFSVGVERDALRKERDDARTQLAGLQRKLAKRAQHLEANQKKSS